MASNVKRDHHTWTRDTIKNVSGDVTLDLTGDLTIDVAGGQMTVIDDGTGDPDLIIKSTSDTVYGGSLKFVHEGGSQAINDQIGSIIMYGQDTAGNTHVYSQIITQAVGVADGSERGRLDLAVSADSGIPTIGLRLESPSSGRVDVDLGATTSSVTTIAGDLDIDGDTITSAGALEIDAGGDVTITGQKLSVDATKGLYFDGGSDTYIYESGADILRIVVGDDILLQLSELGDDGNEVNFGSSCVGFTQLEPTYDATSTIVDFRHSNKQFVTFGAGNITNLQIIFPQVSGNFVCLLKQDGTGSRTITNYKAMEFDESSADGATGVKFPGGSNPTLTTDANHVDILSFYWDADNEIAYGVATLDFQD